MDLLCEPKMKNDNKTPTERFDDLLGRIFGAGKKKPRPEADAEEIAEGGIPPASEGEPDE